MVFEILKTGLVICVSGKEYKAHAVQKGIGSDIGNQISFNTSTGICSFTKNVKVNDICIKQAAV